MDWWTRWRADLARPEAPTGGEEASFLTASAGAVIAIAQLTDPDSVEELLLLA